MKTEPVYGDCAVNKPANARIIKLLNATMKF